MESDTGGNIDYSKQYNQNKEYYICLTNKFNKKQGKLLSVRDRGKGQNIHSQTAHGNIKASQEHSAGSQLQFSLTSIYHGK